MGILGIVTIGQAPRADLVRDLTDQLNGVEVLERGALDDLDEAGVLALGPEAGDGVLATRLRDCTTAVVARERLIPLIQSAINQLEHDGASVILVACTERFESLHSSRPLLFPEALFGPTVAAMAAGRKVGVLCPVEEQIPDVRAQWRKYLDSFEITAVNPYQSLPDDFTVAGQRLAAEDCSLIAMDCMGYSVEMMALVHAANGLPVLLSRTVVARFVAELING
jgi:protein AroM